MESLSSSDRIGVCWRRKLVSSPSPPKADSLGLPKVYFILQDFGVVGVEVFT